MTEIQQNRWDQLVRRAANIVGGGSQVSDTLNELFPVIDVERVPGELLLLAGTRISFGGGVTVGAATTAGRAQLFNPVNSNVLATITGMLISTSADTIIRFGVNNTALSGGIGTETLRDLRNLQPNSPTCQIRTQITVALADATGQTRVLASDPLQLEDPNGLFVLSPATGIEVGPSSFNIGMNFTFFWRERAAEASELSL